MCVFELQHAFVTFQFTALITAHRTLVQRDQQPMRKKTNDNNTNQYKQNHIAELIGAKVSKIKIKTKTTNRDIVYLHRILFLNPLQYFCVKSTSTTLC